MPRILNDWISSYLSFTSETEPRESFRRWSAISGVAAALQRKCWMRMGLEVFYPNMYIVLVGPPASRKGTAMRPVRTFLESLGITLAADESSRQKLVSKMACTNSIVEYQNGNVETHSSITIFSSELTVFLNYKNIDLLTILCKWFDCESTFTYDTHAHGEQYIHNVWVNLLGATTPRLLRESLPEASIGSGFTSRTIFVYERDKEKIVIYPTFNEDLYESLTRDLEQINVLSGEFKMEKSAFKAYSDWRYSWEHSPPFRVPALEFYLDRRQVHLLKLCMIYSASRSDELVVRKEDYDLALRTLEAAEKNMPRVFEGVGRNPLAEVTTRIIAEIVRVKKTSLPYLAEMFTSDVTQSEFLEVMAMLRERGVCTINPKTREVKYVPEDKRNGAKRLGDNSAANRDGEDKSRGRQESGGDS